MNQVPSLLSRSYQLKIGTDTVPLFLRTFRAASDLYALKFAIHLLEIEVQGLRDLGRPITNAQVSDGDRTIGSVVVPEAVPIPDHLAPVAHLLKPGIINAARFLLEKNMSEAAIALSNIQAGSPTMPSSERLKEIEAELNATIMKAIEGEAQCQTEHHPEAGQILAHVIGKRALRIAPVTLSLPIGEIQALGAFMVDGEVNHWLQVTEFVLDPQPKAKKPGKLGAIEETT